MDTTAPKLITLDVKSRLRLLKNTNYDYFKGFMLIFNPLYKRIEFYAVTPLNSCALLFDGSFPLMSVASSQLEAWCKYLQDFLQMQHVQA